MKFTFYHFNFNVLDLERSIRFYDEALGLKPVREKASEDGSYKLAFEESITNSKRDSLI